MVEENFLNVQAGRTEEIQRIISPTTWKYLQRGYFFSRWLALHPYEWDEATNRPKVATGFFRMFFWHLHLLSAIMFYGVLVYRCVQVTVLQPGSRLEQMYVLFLAAFYSLFIVSQMHAALKRYEIMNWIQGFFLLTTKCEELYLHGTQADYQFSATCGWFLLCMFNAFWTNVGCIMAVSLMRVLVPQLNVPSLWPTEINQLGLYGIIGTMAFEILIALSCVEIVFVYSSWLMAFLITVNGITDATRLLIAEIEGRHGNAAQKFLRLFRSLRLITEECSRVALLVTGGAHAVGMGISIICGYAAIRLHGVLSICLGWTGMNITIVLAAFIPALGNTNCSSRKAIKMIRQRPAVLQRAGKETERKWLEREVRCLQDLRMRMGSAFFYDKGLVVTTFEIILQNIVNLLLLH